MISLLPLLLPLFQLLQSPAAHAAEPHWVPTADGAWVYLERHAAAGPAVVLCHGISSNHHFWDLEPGRSLAHTLQAAGYDVWNLDLRGHGPARNNPEGRRQRAGWTVDDYGQHDLPAAFAHIAAARGGDGPHHYVGHSMGGMVLAVYLASHAETPLSSAVLVGSPLDFRDADRLTHLALGGSRFGRATPFIPTPFMARLASRLRRAPLHADDLLFNPANISAVARKEMYRSVVSPLSRGEIRQFGHMVHDGEFRPADGGEPWRTQLGHVQLPIRFIAGRADRIAPPDRVWTYHESVGSAEKDFVIAGAANGFVGDYGHLDLGVGDHAETDVYPYILGWLREHP